MLKNRKKIVLIFIFLICIILAIYLAWRFRWKRIESFYAININEIKSMVIYTSDDGKSIQLTERNDFIKIADYLDSLSFKRTNLNHFTGSSYRLTICDEDEVVMSLSFIGNNCWINNKYYKYMSEGNQTFYDLYNSIAK